MVLQINQLKTDLQNARNAHEKLEVRMRHAE